MSDLAARFTIERATAPTFRNEQGDLPQRFLGHDNDGRIGWLKGIGQANVYDTARDAKSFRQHRIGENARARIIRHTVH